MCSLPEPQKTLLLPVHPAGLRQYDPFFLVPVFFISLSGGIAGGENALNAVCVQQAVPQNRLGEPPAKQLQNRIKKTLTIW